MMFVKVSLSLHTKNLCYNLCTLYGFLCVLYYFAFLSCTCIRIVWLWVTSYSVFIWPTYGPKECNQYVYMYTYMHTCTCVDVCSMYVLLHRRKNIAAVVNRILFFVISYCRIIWNQLHSRMKEGWTDGRSDFNRRSG